MAASADPKGSATCTSGRHCGPREEELGCQGKRLLLEVGLKHKTITTPGKKVLHRMLCFGFIFLSCLFFLVVIFFFLSETESSRTTIFLKFSTMNLNWACGRGTSKIKMHTHHSGVRLPLNELCDSKAEQLRVEPRAPTQTS